jgi:hydroxyacylglutathione hydrolase
MSDPLLQIHVELDPMFLENGYVLHVCDGGDCWMIDPGLPPHAERMCAFVQSRKLTVSAIVLTHAHADHIAGVDEVRERLGAAPLYLAREEWPSLADPARNHSADFGLSVTARSDDLHDLTAGETLELEDSVWTILDTSGHSPGGRSLYSATHGVVVVGDALFAGGIGRYDFSDSDGPRLLQNIRDKLLTLPESTRVLSGHGRETTIGAEKHYNPFLQELT